MLFPTRVTYLFIRTHYSINRERIESGHNRRIGGWVEIVGSATSITCILQLDMLRDKGRKKSPSYRPFSTGDL
uniref:Uncharacterized protein n=1 Tax=Picea glauca TaxID=3330 RepID=A0A117NGW4_PICGL|nr:hypothetical protein ABT39_MTgene5608 [Picea glauca]QHR87838.1 hypothetical protein Q903MT_gene1850 [Picea sitchensis]